jgi:hypothetical protein
MEAGRFHFPAAPAGARSVGLSAGQFQMILDGIDLLGRRLHRQKVRP